MKRKTLLFFSLLLVALSAGAQATTLWNAETPDVGTAYPYVLSYSRSNGAQDGSTLDGEHKWFNTGNNEHYMLIKGDAFTATEGATGYKITLTVNYSNGNNITLSSSTSLDGDIAVISTPLGGEQNNVARSTTITTDQFKTIQKSGLYLSGVYLNWKKITIEPIKPLTISDEVTNLVNEISADKRRYFKVFGKRMSDDGYAEIKWEEDNREKNVDFKNCYIANGSEESIEKESFNDVKPGDILHVYIENPEALNYSEPLYDDKNDEEVTDGNTGAWAGLCVGSGWLAPKYHCFPIKGHFEQVLDQHMVDLMKSKGLTIKGCKFQLDYVVIEKSEERTATPYILTPQTIFPTETDNGELKTKSGWEKVAYKTLSDDIVKKIEGGGKFTLEYYCANHSQIQIEFNGKAYGAYTPTEGGAYTEINSGDGTVSFNITSSMIDNIKKDQNLYIRSNNEVTIKKIEVYTVKKGTTETVELASNNGKWEWSVKDLLNNHGLYWGNILYVESTVQPNISLTAEGKEIRGSFINTNGGNDNSYFMYLDYKDSQTLNGLATTAEDNTMLQITANGGEIKAVRILPERRNRNVRNIEINGNVDWSPASRKHAYIGNVEQGDEIIVETTRNGDNPQLQASIMHMNKKNTKGLAFSSVFKFAEIYDVLTYGLVEESNGLQEKATERIDNPSSSMSFTVESQYMAEQLYDNPFTISGQNLTVNKVSVFGKSFVYPEKIGADGKKILWGTMCSPYNIEMPAERVSAYVVEGYDKDMNENHIYPLLLKRIWNIPAGTPVLLYKDEEYYTEEKQDNFNLSIADDKNFIGDEINANLLCGEIMDKTIKNDNTHTYYKLAHQKDNFNQEITAFFKIKDGMEVKTSAGRAYLRLEKEIAQQARAFVFKFEDGGNETTGISNIENNNATTGEKVYYSLNGQRISTPVKSGIYICNGRKVIIK